MPAADASSDVGLVAGRTCGSCNVCCVSLTIDDPELRKLQGFRCRHTQRDNGCAIYEMRPETCRTFHCGYRRLKWVRDTLRPDVSGVLVNLHNEVSATGAIRSGVAFTLLTGAALKADGLAESVAAAVASGVPVYLQIPGPPGYTSSQVRINEVLADAVATRDKARVLDVLRRVRAKGLSGKRTPIVLATRTAPPPG